MDYNYTLRYRTFDSLLEDVKMDLKNFTLEGRISPEQLFKVAMKVTYDLGLRVNMTKQTVLPLKNGRVRLPDDFFVMNYALICGEYTVSTILPQGTNIQEVPYPRYQETPATVDTCTPRQLQSFQIPDYLFAQIEQNVIKELTITLQVPADTATDDKQSNLR